MTFRVKNSPRALWCAALVAPALFAASPALAQDVDNEVSMQTFDPAVGPGNFLSTRTSSGIGGHLAWTAGAWANYGYEPFTVNSCTAPADADGNCPEGALQEIKVVENMVTADIIGSLSLFEKYQLGLKIPVTWVDGHGLEVDENGDASAADGELSTVGLGDIQIEAKGRFYGEPGQLINLGAYIYGTIPMGTITASGSYIGNSSPAVGGALIGDGKLGPIRYGLNLGGIYRATATVGGNTTIGPEFRWNAAAGYEVSPIIEIVADAFGATDFNTKDLGATRVEVDAGVHLVPLGNQLKFTAGGGVGVFKGAGVPTFRALLGVVYSAASQDRDRDGIADDVDACPDAPEDMDGYEDGDGCPEFDNDQDGLPDEADKCPSEPEDVDGFEDKDGCPEKDNDKDGIPDASDHCPLQAETKNGIDDLDGCPDEKDTDADGVPDERDKCIDAAEDTDGFEDTDGCPDPDNDKDGIPDNQDECIDLPEDKKGKGRELSDGCPIDA